MTKKSDTKTTPLMEQYLAIKAKHKDSILFFRMGDFYEMFYKDAQIGAEVLGITLTARGHGKGSEVPLAGFPHHALEVYLAKMIKAGHRVAICEQVEDPKKAKTIVKRDVTEIVTPGTAITEDLLETKQNNYLLAIHVSKNYYGLAKVDVSTGEFELTQIKPDQLKEQIATILPAEILVCEKHNQIIQKALPPLQTITITHRDDWIFNYDFAYESLTDHFDTISLKGFGVEELPEGISAAGAIIHYLKENQKEKLVHITKLSRFNFDGYMLIDSVTRRNLELIQSMSDGSRKGSLLSVLDKTLTPMGGRMLVNWIIFPLNDLDKINSRQDAVNEFVTSQSFLDDIRNVLKNAGDLERLLAKFATGRANARDANAVLSTLNVVRKVKGKLENATSPLVKHIFENLHELDSVIDKIDRAIIENPPLSITDGGFIKKDFDVDLDELRDIALSGKDWIAKLQREQREATGISSLKVNFNKVFGYYIEVTKPNLDKVPSFYIRKQTMVNAERFITQELKDYEEKILGAEEKMASIEYRLFEDIRQYILGFTREFQQNAQLLAQLDCLCSLAWIAVKNNYNRPEMNNDSLVNIVDGRHPVVEMLLPAGDQFVVNDIKIDNLDEQIHILTGPNMAGKSTFLRQIGLVVVMAQMGGFVPAKSAQIGLVDRVFTRVGASDNLAAGESTFLTEMNETANILNNATAQSLILLDEIGRGTSTFDGLSIAWSVVEYIHNTSSLAAKTVFATHYHELTELERTLPRVKNYNVAVKEWGDHIVFLRKIIKGGCDHSYGIHVAQLAGLPKPVIARAKEVLHNLEAEEFNAENQPKIAKSSKPKVEAIPQMSLFSEMEEALRKELDTVDPNELTPLEALNKLDQLKQIARK